MAFLPFSQLWAANVKGLDTSLLGGQKFEGVSKKTGEGGICQITVSQTERDYAGRFLQFFSLSVPSKTSLNRTLELKQVSKIRSPSFLISKRFFAFEFEMRDVSSTPPSNKESYIYRVEIVSEVSDPNALSSVRVFRESKVDETDIMLFDCLELHLAQPKNAPKNENPTPASNSEKKAPLR